MHLRTCKRCGGDFAPTRPRVRYCQTCATLCHDCGKPRDHTWRISYCRACHQARNLANRTAPHRQAKVKATAARANAKRNARHREVNQEWRLQRRNYTRPKVTAPDGGLTQAEAARRLGVSRERVRQLVQAGLLPTPITAEAVELRRARRQVTTSTPD